MCIESMVMDHYDPYIPIVTAPYFPRIAITPIEQPSLDGAKLIREFKEALELAQTLDKLTGQPDCVDPEKEKLIARVAELEKALGAEFVIVEGGGLEPGTYRVIEGKLYRAV